MTFTLLRHAGVQVFPGVGVIWLVNYGRDTRALVCYRDDQPVPIRYMELP